jgi:hypothetical protein
MPALPSPLALLPLALILGGCDHFRSFESVCEARVGPTRIAVQTAPVSFETDLTRSRAELAQKDPGASNLVTLGLVAAEMNATAEYATDGIIQRRTGRYCMRPALQVSLSYSPMTLFVAREQTQGSCEFDLTMEHELKHVRTFEAFLPDVAAQIQENLAREFGNRIQYFRSEADAQRHVQGVTRDFLGPLVAQSMSRVKALQAQVDSPEEYERIRLALAACRDEPHPR